MGAGANVAGDPTGATSGRGGCGGRDLGVAAGVRCAAYAAWGSKELGSAPSTIAAGRTMSPTPSRSRASSWGFTPAPPASALMHRRCLRSRAV